MANQSPQSMTRAQQSPKIPNMDPLEPQRSQFPIKTIVIVVGVVLVLGLIGVVVIKMRSTLQTEEPVIVVDVDADTQIVETPKIPPEELDLIEGEQELTTFFKDVEAIEIAEDEILIGTMIFSLRPGDDPDEDGLSNAEEDQYGTDKLFSDTDGDGFSDGEEVKNGFNPNGPGQL